MNNKTKKDLGIHQQQRCNIISIIIRKLSDMFNMLVAKYKIISCSTLRLLLARKWSIVTMCTHLFPEGGGLK